MQAFLIGCVEPLRLALSNSNSKEILRDFISVRIGRVSYLIYVSMRHYVLTTSGDIVVCFHTAVCLSC